MFSAKIIYENTIFAKNVRACGAKMKDLAKILENKGGILKLGGILMNIWTDEQKLKNHPNQKSRNFELSRAEREGEQKALKKLFPQAEAEGSKMP